MGGEASIRQPGGFMVLGGMIVILVVYLEARASRLASREDRLDNRLRN